VNKVRKKHTNASPGDVEELAGELEGASRSPTPTPPVLQPEVEPASEEQPQEEEEQVQEQEQEEEAAQVEEEAEEESEEVEEQQQEVQEEEEEKYIPRLLDAAGNATPRSRDQSLEPESWTVKNLASFLEVNECSNLVTNFALKEVDGRKFLNLTKQEIMSLVNNKMGPCLKVEHLQKLLKDRLSPAQARLLSLKK
jgi:type IV secretory pathway VirB10-like protein